MSIERMFANAYNSRTMITIDNPKQLIICIFVQIK